MALNVTIDDVQLVALNISTSGEGAGLTLILDADWLALNENGDAIVVLNNYAEGRIKAAKGI